MANHDRGTRVSESQAQATQPAWRLENLEVRDQPPAEASPRLDAGAGPRLAMDPDKVANGLAQLVLTLVKFLSQLMERQAVRRMELGTLSPEQVEKLGVALMKQAEELDRLRQEFGLEEEQLNMDLGPLGRLI